MNPNPLPRSRKALLTKAGGALGGADEHGAAIGLEQCTAARIRLDRDALAAREGEFRAASALDAKRQRERRVFDRGLRRWMTRAVGVLRCFISKTWSPAWEAAGFSNGSLALPRSAGARLGMLPGLRALLDTHPEWSTPQCDFTPDEITARHTAGKLAHASAASAKAAARAAKQARDATDTRLRLRLRCLGAELALLIPRDDSRWRSFALRPQRAA